MSKFLSNVEKNRKRRFTFGSHRSFSYHSSFQMKKNQQFVESFRTTNFDSKEEAQSQPIVSGSHSHSADAFHNDRTISSSGDDDEKIQITERTLEVMKAELDQQLYPTTLYCLGEALSNSESVISDYCHPIERDEYWNADSSQDSLQILEGLNNQMKKLQFSKESKMKAWSQEEDEVKQRGKELVIVLRKLSKKVGSLDEKIDNWDQAKDHLSTVFMLPNFLDHDDVESLTREQQQLPCPKRSRKMKQNEGKLTCENSVHEYFRRIMDKMIVSKHIIWKSSRRWLQMKHASPPTRYRQNNQKVQQKKDQLDQNFKLRSWEEEREARFQESETRKRIEEDIIKKEKEKEAQAQASSLLSPLTEDDEKTVKDSMYGIGEPSETIAQCKTDSVQRQSMHSLQPGQWLNDEVIHYFYLMLANRDEQLSKVDPSRKRSHFYKSFFLTKLFDEGASNKYKYSNVKRWSKRVPGKDIFALDKIFFPCNLSNVHWACAVIFVQEKRIQFYDSMTGDGMYHMNGLLNYLKDEWKAKKGGGLPDLEKWRLLSCTADTPVQENGFDCGVFTCMFADFLSMDRPLSFSQRHVTECRKRIALSIMKGIAIE